VNRRKNLQIRNTYRRGEIEGCLEAVESPEFGIVETGLKEGAVEERKD